MANGGYTGALPARDDSPEAYSGVWESQEQYAELAAGRWAQQATGLAPRSVRLNSADSASFSRTPASAGNRKTWTWSGWVKLTETGLNYHTLFSANPGPAGTNYFAAYIYNNRLTIQDVSGGTVVYNFVTSQVLRDYSAWYHFVFALDTTQATASQRFKLYLNGQQITSFNTSDYPATQNALLTVNTGSVVHSINNLYGDGSYFGSFYLALVHFIDGQALSPEAFGFFDGAGVWQPRPYRGTYGTNGFYLDFSDNSAATATTLGADRSGNGNNWSPNNISIGGVDYNALVTATATGGVRGDLPKSNAFDNDLNTYASSTSAGSSENEVSISFNFSAAPVTVTSTVRVYFNAGSSGAPNCRKARINGGAYVANGSTDYAQFSFSGTLTSIDSTLGPGTGGGFSATIAAIDIDGTRLISAAGGPAGNDSLLDSPVNGRQSDTGLGGQVQGNYCTLNPLQSTSGATLSNGNLDAVTSSTSWQPCIGSIYQSSGKWYAECTVTSFSGAGGHHIGIVGPSFNATAGNYVGTNVDSYGYRFEAARYNNGTQSSYGSSYGLNDIIGVAMDLDAGTLTFYKNGVSQGQAFSGLSGPKAFAVSLGGTSGTYGVSWNFGQRQWAYQAPSGYKALCTANLPEPAIKRGDDYFQTLLYTGNGSTQTISGLGFNPDLVWIKGRSAAATHTLTDSVRGTNSQLFSNRTDAQETVTDALTTFNSDGFSLGANTSGVYPHVNVNGFTYVAWAWDAGSSTVTLNPGDPGAGSISSQVRANASAGFSVVGWNYPGGTGASTIGHGLGVKPGMIILKSRDNAYNWIIYHSAIGATKCLRFTTAAASTESDPWNNTEPTSTVFSIGAASWHGAGNMIAYCFAPVTGYSSMGSYVASSGLPFVYLGFRPRFLLIKNITTASTNWRIIDSARDTYNDGSGAYWLKANTSDAEVDERPVDFLSNGFKLRMTDAGDLNYSSDTYIYFAVAENPFAYARAR